MKAVFVTGASGFIGLHVVKTFVQHEWHVFAVIHKEIDDELQELSDNGAVTLISADVTEYNSIHLVVKQCLLNKDHELKAIVHCAGRASDIGRRKSFQSTNFDSVKYLTNLVQSFNIDKFIYISTTDVYGLLDFNGQNEDELEYNNNRRNFYPEFKIQSERWIKQYLPSSRYVIIRPAAVWGLGDKTLCLRIIDFLKTSPVIVHFGKWKGKNRWPLAHVKNVANTIFCAVISDDVNGKAINIIDEDQITMDCFYKKLAEINCPNKKHKVLTLPLWIGVVFGGFVTTISNLLNLKLPFMDPSLYAVYSVSSHLDFSHQRMKKLLSQHHVDIVNFQNGIEELQRHTKGKADDKK